MPRGWVCPDGDGYQHQLTEQTTEIGSNPNKLRQISFNIFNATGHATTVKVGDKEQLDKEEIGVKELSIN